MVGTRRGSEFSGSPSASALGLRVGTSLYLGDVATATGRLIRRDLLTGARDHLSGWFGSLAGTRRGNTAGSKAGSVCVLCECVDSKAVSDLDEACCTLAAQFLDCFGSFKGTRRGSTSEMSCVAVNVSEPFRAKKLREFCDENITGSLRRRSSARAGTVLRCSCCSADESGCTATVSCCSCCSRLPAHNLTCAGLFSGTRLGRTSGIMDSRYPEADGVVVKF